MTTAGDRRRPELRYNIASGELAGNVDGMVFHERAGSGGRAGSKQSGSVNWWLANNPLATQVKLNSEHSNIGGPLPMATYRLSLHESRSNWIRLTPVLGTGAMYGRAGFAIHGRGERGSDGCIVPENFAAVQRLCRLVKARADEDADPILLEVFALGQQLDRQQNTA